MRSSSSLQLGMPIGHLHVHPIAAWRRLAIVALALAISAFAFRGYVAAGLVNRGDDLLRAGQPDSSLKYYQRAMFFDPGWDTPVDRLAFAASMSGQKSFLQYGIRIATQYLAHDPSSENVRWDRAICYLHLNLRAQGYADMKYLSRMTFSRHDDDARRYADITSNLAMRLGDKDEARTFAAMREVR